MNHVDRIIQTLRIKQVLPYIQPGAKVLDVGCDDGALLRHAPQIGTYVGVDPNAPTAGDTRARYVRGPFPDSDLLDGSYDVITLLAVLEHIPRESMGTFARACAAALRPGGVLAITVPSALVDPILHVLMRLKIADGMEAEQHYGFDPSETTVVFVGNGFTLEKHTRFELGLNHLFVFRRCATEAASAAS